MDLTGKKFGKWEVLTFAHKNKFGHDFYNCKCSCGVVDVIRGHNLTQRKSKNCKKCKYKNQRKYETIKVGDNYGDWKVLSINHQDKYSKIHYLCECKCGNKKTIVGTSLKNGDSKSCGCSKSKNKDTETTLNMIYRQYISDAIKRNYAFNLTFDQFELLIQQDCSYCGKKPTPKNHYVKKNGELNYNGKRASKLTIDKAWVNVNGIDRKNNEPYYSIKNSVTCCNECNYAKKNMSFNEWEQFLERIFQFKLKNYTKLYHKSQEENVLL